MLHLVLIIMSMLLGGVSILLLIYGLIKKSRKKILIGLVLFGLCLVSGSITAVFFAENVIGKLTSLFSDEKTDEEHYAAYFGTPETCTQIVQYRSPQAPILDESCYAHIKCCPDEITRLTVNFTSPSRYEEHSNPDWPEWFNPTKMGEDVIKMESYSAFQRGPGAIYINKDSTEALIVEYGH